MAVIVTEYEAAGVDLVVEIVSKEVPLPGAAKEIGERAVVIPWPGFEALSDTEELNPYKTLVVIFVAPLFPTVTVTPPEFWIVKLGPATAMETYVRRTCPPPDAVMVAM